MNPELFRPLVRMPCCTGDCQRCAAHLGGFKFLWLGLWSSRVVVIPPDVQPGDAWVFYYRHHKKLDLLLLLLLLLLAAYTNHTTTNDLVPQEMYTELRCAAGDAGQLGVGELCFAACGPAGSRAHRALSWLDLAATVVSVGRCWWIHDMREEELPHILQHLFALCTLAILLGHQVAKATTPHRQLLLPRQGVTLFKVGGQQILSG